MIRRTVKTRCALAALAALAMGSVGVCPPARADAPASSSEAAPTSESAILARTYPEGPAGLDAFLADWEAYDYGYRRDMLRMTLVDRERTTAIVERLMAEDPEDFLTRFAHGRLILEGWEQGGPGAVEDSIEVARILAVDQRDVPPTPGEWVEKGSIHVKHRETEAWRAAMRAAHEGYAAAGRPEDSRRALLEMTDLRGGATAPGAMEADIAELRELIAEADDVRYHAEVLLIDAKRALHDSFAEAGRLREEACTLLEPLGPSWALARGWWGLGNVRKRTGDIPGAVEAYERSREVARRIGASSVESDAVRGLAQIARRQGRLEESLELYEAVRDYLVDWGELGRLASLSVDLRVMYHRVGRYVDARRAAERAVQIARAIDDRRTLGPALDGLASEEAMIGRLDRARVLFEEALEALRLGGRPGDGIFLRVHLAELYQDLARYDESERIILEGLELSGSLGHARGEIFLRYLQAKLAKHRGDYASALEIAKEIREASRETDFFTARKATRLMAAALWELDRIDEALAELDAAERSLVSGAPDPDELGRILELRAILLSRHGRWRDAEPWARRACEVTERTADEQRICTAGLTLGRILVYDGAADEAVAYLERGLSYAERVNTGITVGEERTHHMTQWYEDYVALARAYIDLGRPADAFAVLERSRARELRRSLHAGARGLAGRIPAELAGAIESVEAELAGVQSTLVAELAKPEGARRADFADVETRGDALRRERDELAHRLEREHPALAGETRIGEAVSADELRRSLAPGEGVLATMVGERQILVFRVLPDEMAVRVAEINAEELGEIVRGITQGLRDGDPPAVSRPARRRLAEALFGGVRAEDVPTSMVVLPDGALHRLPFEILPVGAGDDAPRLIDLAEVTYASSATLWHRGRANAETSLAARAGRRVDGERTAGACEILAFGDPSPGARDAAAADRSPSPFRGSMPTLTPLPHARREVRALEALAPETCVRLGDDATEPTFYRDAPGARIVHVAAHAWVDDARPAYSGFALAPAPAGSASDDPGMGPGAEDGLVQAWEVMRTDLSADLVTLSACETGRGAWLRGEGIVGLARAFRIAGARSLLVSLWEVDDAATADFMRRFYERLFAGARPSEALREAKLSFAEEARESKSTAQVANGPIGAAAPASDLRGVGRRPDSRRTGEAAWAAFVLLGGGGE